MTLKHIATTFVATTIIAAFFSCSDTMKKKSSFDPQLVNFQVSYNHSFDNTLYPSYILAMANYNGKKETDLFTMAITAPKNNSVVRIVIDSSKLNYVTTIQTTLKQSGQRYKITPLIKWKYDELSHIKQPAMVDLTFTLYINDEEVDIKNKRLNYRSINECLLGLRDSNNQYIDYRWLFVAFVNEEHPYLDHILDEILQQGIINRFSGYQMNEKHVNEQVFAIWYYIQTKGIRYSSISNTSKSTKTANTQYIRFLDEVYHNKQANCIDACVFMASILEKIGIHTVIFLDPSHAYLGYYKDKKKKKMALLETTIAGNINLNAIVETGDHEQTVQLLSKYNKYLQHNELQKYENGTMTVNQIKENISRESFRIATNYDIDRYNKNKKMYNDPKEDRFSMLDISDLRGKVQPIVREPDIYKHR